MMRVQVIKVGGNQLDEPDFVAGLARYVAEADQPVVIVHGGGRAIGELQRRFGIEPRTVDGLRVTDATGMRAVEMALSGEANKRLVAALLAAGVDALGLSGVDRGLIRARRRLHPSEDLGRVGVVEQVRAEVLLDLLKAGVTPVVSPVSLGEDGASLNVNADLAAAAVAVALGAESLDFVSNVPGVLVEDDEGQMRSLERLDAAEAERLIAAGVVREGMMLKVRAALDAVAAGVGRARIVDLDGLAGDGGTVMGGESPHPPAPSPTRGEGVRARADGGRDVLAPVRMGTEMDTHSNPTPGTTTPSPLVGEGAGGEWVTPLLDPSRLDPDTATVIAAEAAHVMQTYVRPPMVPVRGEGVWLWDAEGRRYLDMTGGIAVTALGHSDPAWAAVVAEQADRLTHLSNLYYNLPMVALAQRLTRLSFADRVFFTNSGAEANEAAIKLARKWALDGQRAAGVPLTKTAIIAFERSFHGRTAGALSLTAKAAYREPFGPLLPDVRFLPFNDAAAARAAIGPEVCAVFVEPVQGEGGVTPANPEFLRVLRRACDAADALLVFDEVQCGLGRSGKLWAHEALGPVRPDMMTVAKPLAGGLPIGALLTTERLASVLTPGTHGSTFAGGPLICRAACEVLDRIAEPAFLQKVELAGEHLRQRLAELQDPRILEPRGLGLLLGLAFDRPIAPLLALARLRGLLIISAGPDVLRLAPPLIISSEEIDQAVAILAESLAAWE